jgi:hypothetical protein
VACHQIGAELRGLSYEIQDWAGVALFFLESFQRNAARPTWEAEGFRPLFPFASHVTATISLEVNHSWYAGLVYVLRVFRLRPNLSVLV